MTISRRAHDYVDLKLKKVLNASGDSKKAMNSQPPIGLPGKRRNTPRCSSGSLRVSSPLFC
jgi:hypothetical protein